MPRQNGKGPLGYGAGTGKGMGPCGSGMAYGGRGSGRGSGWRRFWGFYPGPALSKKDEAEILAGEKEAMEEELKNINDRLAELKK
jgi:hypothetical protein